MAARPRTMPPSKRNPTANATPSITRNVMMLRMRSEIVRPISTAACEIGRERSRSMKPFWRSSASPTPVKAEPNTTVWAKMPGSRYCS